MILSVSKNALNYKLWHVIELSYIEAIARVGLVEAQWVKTRGNRECRRCNKIIVSGALALTGVNRSAKGRKNRTHICTVCSEIVLSRLNTLNREIDKRERGI